MKDWQGYVTTITHESFLVQSEPMDCLQTKTELNIKNFAQQESWELVKHKENFVFSLYYSETQLVRTLSYNVRFPNDERRTLDRTYFV